MNPAGAARAVARLARLALLSSIVLTGVGASQAAGGLGPPPLGLDLYMSVPPDNAVTREKVELGRMLFFDPLLSRDRSVSCASCHKPHAAFADTRARSHGVGGREPRRNTPSIVNAGYAQFFFWDGRTRTLEEQVLQPLVNPAEMDEKLDAVVSRLTADRQYRDAFAAAFGAEASITNLARALASYVRTLRSGNSPADRYEAGEAMALDDDGREGLRLFRGKARCVECHMGPLLSDGGFHNTGVGWGGSDIGRMQITGDRRDRGRFKTPSLRDVSLTAPYMHDGSLSTLPEVVDFYDKGAHANSNLDARIRPLALWPLERRQLVAYLSALTGER